jgi:hypothetical protein
MNHKLKVMLKAACTFLCGLGLSIQVFGQTLPDGKGKAEFVHNCTACHRADMVVAVKKTPEDWRKSVDEMAARGTDGTKEDLDNVVLYLVTNFALDKPAPSPHAATPSSPPEGSAMLNPSGVDYVKRVIAENGYLTSHRIEQLASIGPSLNAVETRRKASEVQVALFISHPTRISGNPNPAPFYERKITADAVDSRVRYLISLPPLP